MFSVVKGNQSSISLGDIGNQSSKSSVVMSNQSFISINVIDVKIQDAYRPRMKASKIEMTAESDYVE